MKQYIKPAIKWRKIEPERLMAASGSPSKINLWGDEDPISPSDQGYEEAAKKWIFDNDDIWE